MHIGMKYIARKEEKNTRTIFDEKRDSLALPLKSKIHSKVTAAKYCLILVHTHLK